MRHVPGRQAAAVDKGDRRRYPARRRHRDAPSRCGPHNLSIHQRDFLSQTGDAIGEYLAPLQQTLLQALRALIGSILLNAVGCFCDRDRRQGNFGVVSLQPIQDRLIRAF
jgi:hypothetical protein